VQPQADCVKTIQRAEEKLSEKKKELEKFQVTFPTNVYSTLREIMDNDP
jgi:hypothetical protein